MNIEQKNTDTVRTRNCKEVSLEYVKSKCADNKGSVFGPVTRLQNKITF
jgi:hypothetical protein